MRRDTIRGANFLTGIALPVSYPSPSPTCAPVLCLVSNHLILAPGFSARARSLGIYFWGVAIPPPDCVQHVFNLVKNPSGPQTPLVQVALPPDGCRSSWSFRGALNWRPLAPRSAIDPALACCNPASCDLLIGYALEPAPFGCFPGPLLHNVKLSIQSTSTPPSSLVYGSPALSICLARPHRCHQLYLIELAVGRRE
jgi:hypothetical protein